jgi:hypothetical protein
LTTDMTLHSGGLGETPFLSFRLNMQAERTRRVIREVDDISLGPAGLCRVPIIPGRKASGVQAPVLRRPARRAEMVRIVSMTPLTSAMSAAISRLSTATEGNV